MVIKFLRRPQADISLHIEGDSFSPGDTVSFRATIGSRKGFDVRSARLSLLCVETYWQMTSDGKTSRQQKRTRTIAEVSHDFMSEGRFERGIPHVENAAIALPADAPPTVTGKHANLSWKLRLSVDVPGARDLQSDETFTVVPANSGPLVSLGGGRSPVVIEETFGDCRLRLELPADEFQAGRSFTGRLRLDAIKDCGVPEIRIELVRQEKAGVRKHEAVGDHMVLETDAHYAANRTRQWGFNLTVPDGRWPSADISDTTVSWKVKGILARSRRRDFSVEKEITVY